MRKIGLSTLIAGLLLTLLLALARGTEWFAAESVRGMSDFAEMVEAAFRAAMVTAGFGLLLLLLSLRPSRRAPENEAPVPLVRSWICPACGAENSEADQRCTVCGTPHMLETRPGWRCPFCGTENSPDELQCRGCSAPKDRPLLTWVCESCGQTNPETETRCTACQRRRFTPAPSWTCPVCGIANDEAARQCRLCGAVRRTELWICGYCGRENRQGRSVCEFCGRPRGYQGGSWLCPVCGVQNRADRSVCAGCGQPRNN